MKCYIRIFLSKEGILAVHSSDCLIDSFVISNGVEQVIDAVLDQPFTDSNTLLKKLSVKEGLLYLNNKLVDKQFVLEEDK